MERYVIKCTSPFGGAGPYFFERFRKGKDIPIVGPFPKIFERKEGAELTVAFLKEWAEREYPGLAAEVAELPENLKSNWRFNAEDLDEIRKITRMLGYREIAPKPVIEDLAMRKKITERWYFTLSVVNAHHVYLDLEDRTRFRVLFQTLEEDRIGCHNLMEAEDRLFEKAKARHIF